MVKRIETIKNITNEFLDLDEDEFIDFDIPVILCYSPPKDYKATFKKGILKNEIDDYFNYLDFPDYKYPTYDAIKYVQKNKILEDEPRIIEVYVEEGDPLAKGHEDDSGYIKLFTLLLDEEKRGLSSIITIHQVLVNGQLIAEKVKLTSKERLYEDEMYEENEEDDDNEDMCAICTSSKGEMVTTPCNHKYHLICLKSVPKFICPICRKDIKEFLKTQGVSDEEIKYRLNYQKSEIVFEEMHDLIDDYEIDHMSDLDIIKFSIDSLKRNNGFILPYMDIIFDMNANASNLFAEVSWKQSKKEKGVFIYTYESPVQLIMQMLDPDSKSKARWMYISDFKGTPMYDGLKERLKQVKSKKNQYMIVVMIENIIDARIFNRNSNDNEGFLKVHQNDIIKSLLLCHSCRCHGHCPDETNREQIWGRRALNRLKKIEAWKKKLAKEEDSGIEGNLSKKIVNKKTKKEKGTVKVKGKKN